MVPSAQSSRRSIRRVNRVFPVYNMPIYAPSLRRYPDANLTVADTSQGTISNLRIQVSRQIWGYNRMALSVNACYIS